MQHMSFARRCMWALFNLRPTLRACLLRVSAPLYVRKIGKGSRVYGKLRFIYPFANIEFGERNLLGHEVSIQVNTGAALRTGNDVSFNRFSVIVVSNRLEIGDGVRIAEFVSLRDQEHMHDPVKGVNAQKYKTEPISIGQNSWIGRGVYIGPGTVIGEGCVVAANSVCKGVYPPHSLIAGAPAKVKRNLLAEK